MKNLLLAIHKILNSKLFTFIVIGALVVFIVYQNNQAKKWKAESDRQTSNLFIKTLQIAEKRLDDFGREFTVATSSLLTKDEFEALSPDLHKQIEASHIKTKNLMKAGLAELESNYHFIPQVDTIFDTINIINNDGYTTIETYTDPDGWFQYRKKNGKVDFSNKDSIIYATFLEKPKKENGKEYHFIRKWLKKKVERELFKNLNPYSKTTHIKVDRLTN